jgi:hypothetical protein
VKELVLEELAVVEVVLLLITKKEIKLLYEVVTVQAVLIAVRKTQMEVSASL